MISIAAESKIPRIRELRPVANSQMSNKVLLMEAIEKNAHHGCPAQPPMLSSHLRVAGDVLEPAEPSLPASCARAACARLPKKAEICM